MLATCLFFNCNSSEPVFSKETAIENTPKILFLNYQIKNTKDGKRSIALINKKIVDGKLKSYKQEPIKNGGIGDLILTEHDEKSKVLHELLIKNPLTKTFEYVDETKQFQNKTITLKEANFSMRLKLNPYTKLITLRGFSEKNTLIKTKIN